LLKRRILCGQKVSSFCYQCRDLGDSLGQAREKSA
jgi:hypothetical protein